MTQHITISDMPFGGGVREFAFDEGLTIQQIVDRIDRKSPGWMQFGVVLIGEMEIDRKHWRVVRPKPQHLLRLGLRLSGGGGGQSAQTKNVIAIVASIAILAATIAISGGLLAGPLGGFFAAGQWGARIAAAGVGLLGSLALSAITKPANAVSSDSSLQPSAASVTGNVLSPNGRIPAVVGYKRLSPPAIGRPVVELIDDNEYAEIVYILAGPHYLTTPQVGDTEATGDLPDIEIELRNGLADDAPLTLVTRQGYQDAPSATLQQHLIDQDASDNRLTSDTNPYGSLPEWTRFTTRNSPDEVWFQIVFPEGMYDADSVGTDCLVETRLRIRLKGSTTWINLPAVQWESDNQTLIQKVIKLVSGTVTVPNTPVWPTREGPIRAYWSVPAPITFWPNIIAKFETGWTADSYFANSATITDVKNMTATNDGVVYYLDDYEFPQGIYEIEIISSRAIHNGDLVASTYVYTPEAAVVDLFGALLDSGHYYSPNNNTFHCELGVKYFTSIWNEPIAPLVGEDALIAIRVKNRSVNNFTILAGRMVPVYNESTGEWSGLASTAECAPHFRDILTGNLNQDPLPGDLVDDTALLSWSDFCALEGITVAFVAEQGSVTDAAVAVATAGRAGLRQSDTWAPVWERDRSADDPIQIFTPINSADYQWEKAFDRLPHALIITFSDVNDEYRDAQILVFDDGYSATGGDGKLRAARYEEARYEAVDNETQASAQGLIDLRTRRLRGTLHSISADVEGLICQRGDLVGLQHDILVMMAGFARVVSVLTDGSGNVTGLILDATVPVSTGDSFFTDPLPVFGDTDFFAPEATGMSIRLADGTSVIKTLTGEGDLSTVTFATPFAMPQAIFDPNDGLEDSLKPGCLISVGPLGTEYRRVLLASARLGKDLTAQLTFVDEAPGIHA